MAENDPLKVSLGVHINILYMSDPPKGCPIKLTKNSLNSSVFADIFQLSAFSGQIILIFAVILQIRSCRKTKTEIRFMRYFHFVEHSPQHFVFGKIFEIAALTSLKNN